MSDERAYRVAELDDTYDCCYQKLIGPNGFECLITEPEDRSFYRDLKDVVDELNKLHRVVAVAERILKRKAANGYYSYGDEMLLRQAFQEFEEKTK